MEEENRVQERRRREEIIGAMDIIPNHMDFNDGCVLLDLLNTASNYRASSKIDRN